MLVAKLCLTPWTVTHQVLLSMEFSRQEYWSGCHSLLLGIFPTQGLNLGLLNCKHFFFFFFNLLSHQSVSSVTQLCDHMIAARQDSLSITNSRSSLKLMSIESVMPSSHLILFYPLLLLPPSLLASESFPMS